MINVEVKVNVDGLVAQMQKNLEAWLKEKNNIFLQRLCEEGKKVAESLFGSTAVLTIDKIDDNTYSLTASGEAVCFIEFGTGVYADKAHPFALEMPFKVEEGSWSETLGAGTWGRWIASGKDKNKYPYNRMPKRPMYEAYKQMQKLTEEIAKEVYK